MLEVMGVDHVVTVDLHSAQVEVSEAVFDGLLKILRVSFER